MLNIFPIQFLAPLAYFILRVVLGLLFIYLAKTHIQNRAHFADTLKISIFPFNNFVAWCVIFIELVVGILLTFGLFTQIASLLAVLYSLKFLVMYRSFGSPLIPARISLLLMFAVSLCLFITGAGAFAFDLPI